MKVLKLLHRRWLCAFEGSPPWRGKRAAAGLFAWRWWWTRRSTLFRPPDSPPGCVWCALICRAAADAVKTDAAATRSCCCWPCWAALNLEAVGKAFLNTPYNELVIPTKNMEIRRTWVATVLRRKRKKPRKNVSISREFWVSRRIRRNHNELNFHFSEWGRKLVELMNGQVSIERLLALPLDWH